MLFLVMSFTSNRRFDFAPADWARSSADHLFKLLDQG